MALTCPYCGSSISPRPNGSCPACGRLLPIATGMPPPRERSGPDDALGEGGRPAGEGAPLVYRPAVERLTENPLARFQQTVFQLTPRLFVTHVLVAANVLVFLAMLVDGAHPLMPAIKDLVDWGANYGPLTLGGQWWRLFTCMFIHVGIMHLGINMWVLWQIGRFVERLVGNAGLVVIYVVSGVGGSLASLVWHPATVSAGASGAVFGLFGGLLGFLARSRHSIPTQLYKSLINSIAGVVILSILFGFAVPAIDQAAHLGGLLTGLLCGLGLSQPVEPAAARRRPWRNLAVAVAGGLLLYGAWQLMPGPQADVQALKQRLQTVDRQGIDTFNDTVEKLGRGEITGEQAADVIERQIVPSWRDLTLELEQLENVPRGERRRFEVLTRYMRLRLESWQSWIEGLRSGDEAALRQAREKSRAAEQALNEFAEE